jgi:NAD(P)-dependent dehydrogenase (short-subunit alcohol dehydrogenase family)
MTNSARVVLITGASAGLGRACADRLASEGWTVAGASRRGTGGTGWTGLVMDVDSDASVQAGLASVITGNGRLDAVVAAAGWGIAGAVEDTSVEEAKAQFETNFWGCVRVVQAALPQMRAQHSGWRGGTTPRNPPRGRIVLISSIGGVIGIPFQAFYSASKFALEGYAEALAYEVAPFGIDVTLVQPGNFKTEFTDKRMVVAGAHGSDYASAMEAAVARMEKDERNGAAPADVAATVVRLLGDRRPPRRVSVGRASERIGIMAKRLLPFRVFESAAKSSLGVG